MIHSCGIIPFRVNADGKMEFFVGHPGGWKRDYWAMLKGQMEDGENASESAVREFTEESGVDLSSCRSQMLIPLGSVMQNPKKMVTAFGLHFPEIDPEKCHSNMADNGLNPEIDSYRWMTMDELAHKTHATHIVFYEKLLSMAENEEKI